MNQEESKAAAPFAKVFEEKTREIFGIEANQQGVGAGCIPLLPAFEPSQRLTNWFKAMYKSTVCSEITGLNWFDMNEVVAHHRGPKGMDTVEKCARLTGGTAYRVAVNIGENVQVIPEKRSKTGV